MSVRHCCLIAVLPLLGACNIQVSDKGISVVEIVEGKASDTWTRQYTLPQGGHLEIVTVNGAIEAAAAEGTEVKVEATREVHMHTTDAARELLQTIEMAEEVSPDRVKIQAKADWEGARRGGRRIDMRVAYRIALPSGLRATLKTENGEVRLENVAGTIVASSTNGSIIGRGVAGSLTATTVNGGIQLQLASVTGDVQVSTVNGSVRVEIPAEANAQIDAKAVNGGVTVDERLALSESTRARVHVTGRLNKGGPRVAAQTTNGAVRIAAATPPAPRQ